MKYLPLLAILSIFTFQSCKEDAPVLLTSEIDYYFHDGQVVAAAPYAGIHNSNFSASMKLDEMEDEKTMITVTLNNTVDGVTYNVHAHDAADSATTPNGTPYNETPNSDVFAAQIEGNGGSVSKSFESTKSYSNLTSSYDGFFVVHDPLQEVSTTDISTYLIVASFARAQTATDFKSSTFDYDFNTGQIDPSFAYSGTHESTLGATIRVDELADGGSRIAITLSNAMDGETYNTHAHDKADPKTTPNMTPYNEMPNTDVFAAPIKGNMIMTGAANISAKSHDDITTTYEGFFVIHDPLQDLTTTDPTTYVILGNFGR